MKAKIMLLALAASSSFVVAQDEAKSTAASEIAAIVSDHQKMMQEFTKKARALPREKQRDFYRNSYPDPANLVTAMGKLIDANPKDVAIIEGMVWIGSVTRMDGLKASHFAVLTKHHLDNEKLGELIAILGYARSEEAKAFLKTVQEETKNHHNKGAALYAASMSLKRDPSKKKEYDEITRKLETEHADLKIRGREVVKAMVAERLAAERLAIGKEAPEIIGKDVDGKEMKLSDYRGKVVVLDFWGDW
jgi:hypothetical protein